MVYISPRSQACRKQSKVRKTDKKESFFLQRGTPRHGLNEQKQITVFVLGGEEGYMAKYGLSLKELPRVQAIFYRIS